MKFFIIFLLSIFLLGCGAPMYFSVDSQDSELLASNEDTNNKPSDGRISTSRTDSQAGGPGSSLRSMRVRDLVNSSGSPNNGATRSTTSTPEYVQRLRTEVESPTTAPKLGAKLRRPANSPGKKGKSTTPQFLELEPQVPPSHTDRIGAGSHYPYYKNGRVDIVIVQDASNSMDFFWTKSRNYFSSFIEILDSSLNWRMMFTKAVTGFFSPDGRAVQLEKDLEYLPPQAIFRLPPMFLSPDLEDYESIFLQSMYSHTRYSTDHYMGNKRGGEPGKCDLRPGCQHWDEQPFSALKKAFGSNDSFFRADADVAAIIISDGDETEISAEQVLQFFNSQWGNKRLVGYSVIMVPHSDETCSAEKAKVWGGEGVLGVELSRLAFLTGGGNYSLCSKNYSNLARQIVDDFKKQ